ncbi:hypothetical protein DVB87_04270 [Tsukamurella tyrosinosolvens]|nr:hypothetical protein DVB87_04270 [Tsukamurella tyrosinosolvens]
MPSALRTAGTLVGGAAIALSYWYWNSSAITADKLLGAAAVGVTKVALIAACTVLLCSCVTLFLPRVRAGTDPLWLVRRLGGPVVAFGTLVGLVAVPVVVAAITGPVALLFVLLVPIWLGATISAGRLGAAHQFRLGEAHPSLASVCILATGAFGLVEALTKSVVNGHEFDPMLVWALATFVGPIATMGLALWDMRIITPRVDLRTMVTLAAVMAVLAGVGGLLVGRGDDGRTTVAALGGASAPSAPASIAPTLAPSGFLNGPSCESRGTMVYRAVTDPDPNKGRKGSRFVICSAGESLWYQGQRLGKDTGEYLPAERTARGYRAVLGSGDSAITFESFMGPGALFVVSMPSDRLEEPVIWSSAR